MKKIGLLLLLFLSGCHYVANPENGDNIEVVARGQNSIIYKMKIDGETYLVNNEGGIIKHDAKTNVE